MAGSLTEDQRKLLGTAIAMAAADGVLDEQEQVLIDRICESLSLSAEGRAEVARMLNTPPSPVEIASWAISARDRLDLYRIAVEMAAVDGQIAKREEALLGCLAAVLRLTPEEVEGLSGGGPRYSSR